MVIDMELLLSSCVKKIKIAPQHSVADASVKGECGKNAHFLYLTRNNVCIENDVMKWNELLGEHNCTVANVANQGECGGKRLSFFSSVEKK